MKKRPTKSIDYFDGYLYVKKGRIWFHSDLADTKMDKLPDWEFEISDIFDGYNVTITDIKIFIKFISPLL